MARNSPEVPSQGNLGKIVVADVTLATCKASQQSQATIEVVDDVTLEFVNAIPICTAADETKFVKKVTLGFSDDRPHAAMFFVKDVVTEEDLLPDLHDKTHVTVGDITIEFNSPIPTACQADPHLSAVEKIVLSLTEKTGTIVGTKTPSQSDVGELVQIWQDLPGRLIPPVIPDPTGGWKGAIPRTTTPPVIPDPAIGWFGRK